MTAKGKLIVLLVIIGATTAALQRGYAEINPNYPGHCWVNGKAYKPGQNWPIPNSCAEGRCDEQEGTLFVTSVSCGVVAASPPCYKTDVDLSKNYPDCCSDIICP